MVQCYVINVCTVCVLCQLFMSPVCNNLLASRRIFLKLGTPSATHLKWEILLTHGQVFSRLPENLHYKSFIMKKFKRGDDSKLQSYIGFCGFLTTGIKINYLNHRFLPLLGFWCYRNFSLSTFFTSRKIRAFSESKSGCMDVLTDKPKYTM